MSLALSLFAGLGFAPVSAYAQTTESANAEEFISAVMELSRQDEQNEEIRLSQTKSRVLPEEVVSQKNIEVQLSNSQSDDQLYKYKRLIVQGNGFNLYGAYRDISGYKDYHILCYNSVEETKCAFQSLKRDGVKVSIDEEVTQESYYENTYSYSTYKNSQIIEKIDIGGFRQYLSDTNASNEIVVAVIDSGINTSHEMFSGRLLTDSDGNIVGSSYYTTAYTYSGYSFEDDGGHGTHVAGIICNMTPSNVKILPIKVFNQKGSGARSYIISALAQVDENYSNSYQIACVNMSLGGSYTASGYTDYGDAIASLKAKNILTVVAAGNESDDCSNYVPASCEDAITVSSLKMHNGELIFDDDYSNYGQLVDISAPGTRIYSAYISSSNSIATSRYATLSGTSMATPHVSGAVALLCLDPQYYLGGNADYTADEIETRLLENAVEGGALGKDDYYGYGILNLRHFETTESDVKISFYNGGNELSLTTQWIEYSSTYDLSVSCSDSTYEIYYSIGSPTPTAKLDELYTSKLTFTTPETIISAVGYKTNGSIIERTDIVYLKFFCDSLPKEDYFTITNSGLITSYSGHFKEISVPSTIDGITVRSVGSSVFEYSDIEKISFPSSCSSISSYAFQKSNLSYLYAPGVTTLGSYAFYLCVNLTSVSNGMPNGATEGMFLPSVKIAGDYTWGMCVYLESANLEKLTTIGQYAFEYCVYMTSCNLPLVSTLPKGCLMYCVSLESFEIGKNVTTIGEKAFFLNRLKSITVASGNTKYYSDGNGVYGLHHTRDSYELLVFANGSNPSDYSIKSNVKIAGTSKTITTLDYLVMYGATIGKLTIPSTIKHLDKEAIEACTIDSLYFNATNMDDSLYIDQEEGVIYPAFADTQIKHLYFAENVETVPTELFRLAYIENIVINSHKTYLSSGCFNLQTNCDLNLYYETPTVLWSVYQGLKRSNISDYLQTVFSKTQMVTSLFSFSYQYSYTTADYFIYSKISMAICWVESSAGQNGTITPEGKTNVLSGGELTVYFSATDNYYVSEILIDGTALTGTAFETCKKQGFYCFENITSNRTIRVNFEKAKFVIEATAGEGGTISPSGTQYVLAEGEITFTFVADSKHNVSEIWVDGAKLGKTDFENAIKNGYTFSNVEKDHEIKVLFAIKTYIIQASAGSGGGISPSGNVTVEIDNDKTFTFSLKTGYYLDTVVIDGNALSGVELDNAKKNLSYTFVSETKDHTISVTFAKIQLSITASTDGNGFITPIGTSKLSYGSSLSYTFRPNEGYQLKEVYVDGVILTDSIEALRAKGYAFTNVKSDHSINAVFEKMRYRITYLINGEGSASMSGDDKFVAHGDSAEIVITPNKSWVIGEVFVNGREAEVVDGKLIINRVTQNTRVEITFREKVKLTNIIIAVGAIAGVISLVPITIAIVKSKRKKKYFRG